MSSSEEDNLRYNADLGVERFGPLSGLPAFGFNRDSVIWVDGFLQRQHARPDLEEETKKGLINVVGSYLGHCVILCHGGTWVKRDGQWSVQFDPKNAVFPFGKVAKQLDHGSEDSIAGFFDMIPVVFRDKLTATKRSS